LDEHVENFGLSVHCAPEIDHPHVDFQIDFIRKPNAASGDSFAMAQR
jgi:hypothetical protein